MRSFSSTEARWQEPPDIIVWRLPAVTPTSGVTWESDVVTVTSSRATPSVSAAIWRFVWVWPAPTSETPVRTLTLPSASMDT